VRVAQWEIRTGRSLERLLNFSDAVVAVAITILALPLVDIGGPKPGQNVLDVLVANLGHIITFISTFFVVAIMWGIHNRVMNLLNGFDSTIFWLNICWLIGFVFLPWPASMWAGGDDMAAWETNTPFTTDGTGVLYWWTLAYISAMGSLVAVHISRHPELIASDRKAFWQSLRSTRARYRGAAFFAIFILAGLATLVYSWLGYWVLLLMLPAGILLRPPRELRTARDSDAGLGE